jgi:hypothetical protein
MELQAAKMVNRVVNKSSAQTEPYLNSVPSMAAMLAPATAFFWKPRAVADGDSCDDAIVRDLSNGGDEPCGLDFPHGFWLSVSSD